MKRFLIKYTFDAASGSAEQWHKHIEEFISRLSNDAELKSQITYRCMKNKEGSDYYHFVESSDEAPNILAQREWFKQYTAQTKAAGGGEVHVLPLDVIAETKV